MRRTLGLYQAIDQACIEQVKETQLVTRQVECAQRQQRQRASGMEQRDSGQCRRRIAKQQADQCG